MATVFDSANLNTVQEYLSSAYARMHLRTRSKHPRARIVRTELGPVSVSEIAFGFEMDYAVNPTGALVLGSVHSGTAPRHRAGDWEGSIGAGDVRLFAQPDQPCAGRHSSLNYTMITIEPQLLSQVAAAAPGRRPGPVRLTGHQPISVAIGQRLRRTLDYLI